jgi:hypothetical protein
MADPAPRRTVSVILLLAGCGLVTGAARAQCPEEPPLQNYTGAGEVVCPCFVAGEQAGAVFNLPAAVFPIEILRVGIGWGSQFGGNPQQLEEAIHIYPAGLPNPGTPLFSLPGPALNDGVINEFDLEPLPGEIVVTASPFSVTLEFMNDQGPFAPSVVHDGNGCQAGSNLVKTESGAWFSACSLGVSGDWVFFVVYRPAICGGSGRTPDGLTVPGTPLRMARIGTSQLLLQWSPSCSLADDDYAIYEGTIGTWYSHNVQKTCTTSGQTSFIVSSPGAQSRYYLVVPHDDDADVEGSYGVDGEGNERPRGTAPCPYTQETGCP